MPYILPLHNFERQQLKKVGGKAFALSQVMGRFNVPPGFVITTDAYDYYLIHKDLPKTLEEELKSLLEIRKVHFPLIARSSATIEDSITHSFAGQFISIFPINSIDDLLDAVKKIYESVDSPKVKSYLKLVDIKEPIKMAVLVQEFIPTNYGGVAFSKNIFENRDEVVVEIARGLTENVVSGKAESNVYFIDKNSISIRKRIERFSLDEKLVKEIANATIELEKLFGYPVDVEFGIKDKLYIFQVRPITPKRRKDIKFEIPKGWAYIEGIPTGTGKAYGIARIVRDKRDLKLLKPGEVLVSKTTYNDWMPDMLKAIAIVNEVGNITSHSAIVAREFGIPTVVNAKNCLKLIKNGMPIFVDADEGKVYYPGNEIIKLYDFTSDFILELTPLKLDSLEKANSLEVIKNPRQIILYEEYLGHKIVYFHYSIDEKTKRKVLSELDAIEGHSDVHWNYVEWTYGFLIHQGLKEWVDRGRLLIDRPRGLDRYLYKTMKLARESISRAYEAYRKAKEASRLEDFLRVLKLVDLSARYFGIANTLIPLGYGVRKLRELAMEYGDYREVLNNIEDYKGTKLYELYRILEKWKNLSDEMDVWDARTQLWNAVRRRVKERFGFDVNDYIKEGTGYYLDLYLWKRFKIKPPYLV